MQASRFQVIETLGHVHTVQRLDCFQFDYDCFLDQQVYCVLADDNAFVLVMPCCCLTISPALRSS
jgi:hypothetical protein